MDEDEFRIVQQRGGSLDIFVKGDDFSQAVYHWLDWTIMENRELSMCEKVKTRKYTYLKPVWVKTLKKHMFGLEEVVQSRIKQQLNGQQVVFIIGAWTEDGTHFVAVIAVTPTNMFLLCFSTLENEADMISDSIIELLDNVLDLYAIDVAHLDFYVCDHASVNVAIAKKTLVPMIGSASHRLNLAVQELTAQYADILDKVHQLMSKLNTIKNRHHLRELDVLVPVFRNATRWSSRFATVDRYFKIYVKMDRIDDRLADVVPNARENMKLKALYEDLKNLESVNKKLQTENCVSLRDVRTLFDHVVENYPATSSYHIASASVKFRDFENANVKLIAGEQQDLARGERTAVAKLLCPAGQGGIEDGAKKKSFADAELSKKKFTSTQMDLDWILASSNDVERLFSRTGIVFSRLRRSMSPVTLESMLFLSTIARCGTPVPSRKRLRKGKQTKSKELCKG